MFRAIGRAKGAGFIRRGRLNDLRFPKNDNKITSALTNEGIAGRRKIRPDRIAKHVFEAGNGPSASS
jgi:hypothetical protein